MYIYIYSGLPCDHPPVMKKHVLYMSGGCTTRGAAFDSSWRDGG